MNMLRKATMAVALGLLLGAAGCNRQDAANLKNDTRDLAQHTGQALNGAGLVAQVNAALALRKDVDVRGLHVEAQNGVVTMGGHVRSEAERKAVLQTAKETRGVNKVIDQLRIAK